jgi:hypothetical protein
VRLKRPRGFMNPGGFVGLLTDSSPQAEVAEVDGNGVPVHDDVLGNGFGDLGLLLSWQIRPPGVEVPGFSNNLVG